MFSNDNKLPVLSGSCVYYILLTELFTAGECCYQLEVLVEGGAALALAACRLAAVPQAVRRLKKRTLFCTVKSTPHTLLYTLAFRVKAKEDR